MDWLTRLHRLEHAGVAVYIDPHAPDWFVPSTRADMLLQALLRYGDIEMAVRRFSREQGESPARTRRDCERLHHLLHAAPAPAYAGRAAHLRSPALKELWFHLTDRCNLSCRHCLFGSSPARDGAIAPDLLDTAISEAMDSGCRLFYFTGGEPFVYPGFTRIIGRIQAGAPDAHVVVLTNGLLLAENRDLLQDQDADRLHLQISLDGLRDSHDRLRGRGSYDRLQENLAAARDMDLSFTLSVAVNDGNVDHLPDIAGRAAECGAAGLHLMYHFVRGKGSEQQFADPDRIFAAICRTAEVCRRHDLNIDNLEVLGSQAFSMPLTRHDLSNMGWESVAIGPDGALYPSPALVGMPELVCGHVGKGLLHAWRQSPVLAEIRSCSQRDAPCWQEDPLHFLTGGGDPDHSFVAAGSFVGHDPYLPLYNRLVLWLITSQAARYPDRGLFRLRMGDVLHDSCGAGEGAESQVRLTHCNCVLSLAERDARTLVREFYGSAAMQTNSGIVNPFAPKDGTDFIPEQSVSRSYGCGSPVRDAAPGPGETVVDLGSGSGVECFLAAADVGSGGRVIGIDMTDAMLALAESSREKVVAELGYDNLEFRKGFLENIPLADGVADVVISNCVINLSPDKRQTYLEILRILKPGGRMVIADIVTDERIDPMIRNSARYRGECLGGAMRQPDLLQMLEDCGFADIFLHRRHPYRQVQGDHFFSLTYEARRPEIFVDRSPVRAVYRGPHRSLVTESGMELERGRITLLDPLQAARCDDSVFLLDEQGAVVNVEQGSGCCGTPPEYDKGAPAQETNRIVPIRRHRQGCMVCGAELVYTNEPRQQSCHFCGRKEMVNTVCSQGHFICDECHQEEGLAVIRHICMTTGEQDMTRLLATIRSHPAIPMHGPEHHAMVPGILLAVFRNSGGAISRKTIGIGIDRGSSIPGGACGFWGSCGAAVGTGIAAALILDATPLTPHPRQQAQAFTAGILSRIAAIRGGRCCQRESWLALTESARMSESFFGLCLRAETPVHCDQYGTNRECIRSRCPLWEQRRREMPDTRLTMAR